ncbi:MAG TPA: D-hexose-6-phosphate mutarotase, partial [Burkholderiaceae bacterium]|nr:D-hexose-6-phosphate mutarotase [Burkholderiaceae bacterium]
LTSWVPAGGEEQLYLSPRSSFATGQAIRGGVPLIFPQFSARGPLMRHGFARSKPWQLLQAEQGADDALAVLQLSDDAATRMVWPHAFSAELSVRVSGRSLDIELAVENTGDTAFDFTAALHTYLRTGALDATSLRGLAGLHYWDQVKNAEQHQRSDLVLPGSPGCEDLDRIYYQVKSPLQLIDESGLQRRVLDLQQQGFEDTVVWNPGAEKCAQLADMPADGYQHFLCVEAAAVERSVPLQPGEVWSGMQSLQLASAA